MEVVIRNCKPNRSGKKALEKRDREKLVLALFEEEGERWRALQRVARKIITKEEEAQPLPLKLEPTPYKPTKNLGKLQRVQNRAARLALKCTSRTNVKNMYDRLFWLKVDERLKASLLSFIKKINTLKTPDCLFRQLTLSSNVYTYPTRHATSGNYTIPTIKTNSKQRTVLCRAMVEWNSLPDHISKTQNKAGFKKQVKQHLMAISTGY